MSKSESKQLFEKSLHYRALEGRGDKPTDEQISIVLHALADHTQIMRALKYRPDKDSPFPEATSVGRWLKDLALEFDR